ncbi:flavin-containing monooxygenase [Parahaliea mediterranea]|uniref:NAD(P)/FAD-dependent oxidoreductase n=1 Tax=Parahaliea mediterranea TaxID=651086 RepID=A0A939IMP0_9GAMM|nr:NAD(P)/FAD-dependent oxidoreductase [Parahaliea mediterranea]MBN7797238.1 NAD(P)/FAD-dependent oxidoreductase [Parahaliea mediterranea]
MSDKPLSVAIIGAGMSGLCMGIRLRERGIDDFVILEKSAGVGGTWYDNTYPGACCDVPSVLYSYSFEPNPWWSRKFSPHDEIRAYFEHCADKYGLRPRLRLNTAVAEAAFDEARGLWVIQLEGGGTLEARALVSGLGQLNLPHIPDFPGRETFGGTAFHSARWNHELDLRGKRVAIIGTAASALQFIPPVAEQAEQLYVYQRSANYVIERNDRAYGAAEQRRFARYPWLQKLHRLGTFLRGESIFLGVLRARGWLRKLFERGCRKYLESQISDPDLRAKLTPDYPAGCKRLLVSDNFFQAFTRDNVELVTSPITGIDTGGVQSADGREREVDVIIYGTGFRTSDMLSGVTFRGVGGADLRDAWRDGAEAYRGVCVSGFPNFFMLYGPNTNLGSNSIIFMVERQVNYCVSCIEKLLSHDLSSLEVNRQVMRDYNIDMQQKLAGTVWVASCESWYKNAAGKVVNNWPRSTLAYWWHMRSPDFADFDMRG